MKFSSIFDVFSRRDKPEEPFVYEVPTTLRNKVILLCQETFSGVRSNLRGRKPDYADIFWKEIHRMLLYRHGRLQLVEGSSTWSTAEDTISFLLKCADDEFLDFIEYIFRVDCMSQVSINENKLVAELNEIFASENVGFELTEMIKEEVDESTSEPGYLTVALRDYVAPPPLAYPQIIRKDSQVIHSMAVRPALMLLSDPKFKSANQEYLEALEDYRKGDYGDSLTKSCSAFESVMKIVCDENGWAYKQTDTANTLIKKIIENTDLDSYFEQPLMIIATLRNRLSKSHGAGAQTKNVSQNLAQYALNSTAAATVLIVNEAK